MQHASDKRAEANRLAFEGLTKSDPVLVDVRPAREFVPGFTPHTILTSGPPMPWSEYVGGQLVGAPFDSATTYRPSGGAAHISAL